MLIRFRAPVCIAGGPLYRPGESAEVADRDATLCLARGWAERVLPVSTTAVAAPPVHRAVTAPPLAKRGR